jgi:hypothetical protein
MGKKLEHEHRRSTFPGNADEVLELPPRTAERLIRYTVTAVSLQNGVYNFLPVHGDEKINQFQLLTHYQKVTVAARYRA